MTKGGRSLLTSIQGGDPAKLSPLTAKGAKVIEVDFADQDSLIAGLKGEWRA